MKSINEVEIMGNLTRDPELKATQSGDKVCTFSIATNRVWKDPEGNKKEQAEFHNCVAWGKAGEVIAQYVKKGYPFLVKGRLRTRSWEDEETKKKMYRTEIVVEQFHFLHQKGDSVPVPEPEPGDVRHDDGAPPPPDSPAPQSGKQGEDIF